MEHPVKTALISQITGLLKILALEWLSIGAFFAANLNQPMPMEQLLEAERKAAEWILPNAWTA
jgi:hypothetical protein